jgi:hypothetical protein
MFFPFEPSSDWYKNYWFSPEPVKLPWRAPALLVTVAAFVVAVWFR